MVGLSDYTVRDVNDTPIRIGDKVSVVHNDALEEYLNRTPDRLKAYPFAFRKIIMESIPLVVTSIEGARILCLTVYDYENHNEWHFDPAWTQCHPVHIMEEIW